MKKVNIHSILSNFENETTTVDTIAEYDEKEKTLNYIEDDLKVKIKILKDKVIIDRKNTDYHLSLEFEQNQEKKCKYEVKSIGLDLDIIVYTKILEIDENIIYINYELFNDNKSIGVFEYKLIIKETIWTY